MPSFKDDSILIIAPGSQTTLAQLGLPESFTPPRFRFRSRMFPGENPGEFEPHRIVQKKSTNGTNGTNGDAPAGEEHALEEDFASEEGAVWPMKLGKVVDWDCFFALLEHVHREVNPPFHTPVLLISQPIWTARDHERITQFVFEKYKCPAFALVDSSIAAAYSHGLASACVVDVGLEKADVTAIHEHIPSTIGRAMAVPGCGGEALTDHLQELLSTQGFSREMCEQLKRSPICEILPVGTPLPGTQASNGAPVNPAAAASTGAEGPGDQKQAVGAAGQAPRGPGAGTEVGTEESKNDEEQDGILDVASIVAGGKMNEYLAKKEKEKQEKLAAKKKGDHAAAALQKALRMKNSEKETNTFTFEDATQPSQPVQASGTENGQSSGRKEMTVGLERFKAAEGQFMETLTSAIYRVIQSHPVPSSRALLWSNLVVVGNGAGVRGFREALLASLNSRFLISPSSATMFTSEIPSNISTPAATGANTPIPHGQNSHHGVNPLLHAATTAAASGHHLHPPQVLAPQQAQLQHSGSHASLLSQTPTAIKLARLPEYFSEWKDVGAEEATFLGAQIAARVLYVVSSGTGNEKGYLSRAEYNENGPSAISDYAM